MVVVVILVAAAAAAAAHTPSCPSFSGVAGEREWKKLTNCEMEGGGWEGRVETIEKDLMERNGEGKTGERGKKTK